MESYFRIFEANWSGHEEKKGEQRLGHVEGLKDGFMFEKKNWHSQSDDFKLGMGSFGHVEDLKGCEAGRGMKTVFSLLLCLHLLLYGNELQVVPLEPHTRIDPAHLLETLSMNKKKMKIVKSTVIMASEL